MIQFSIKKGYPANVKALYYLSNDKKNRTVTKEKLLKYDSLHGTLNLPIVKEPVVEIFKKHCKDKIQIIDIVITMLNGEQITDYKGINVVNRAEVFTWEGSEKGMYYEQYNEPHACSMRTIAF